MSIRLIAEILIGCALIGAIIYLWESHDTKVATAATAICENKVSGAGGEALSTTNDTNQANADILSTTVASYDQKIRDLNAQRDTLAQRVHDYEAAADLHSDKLPAVPRAAGKLPTSGSAAGVTDRDRREAENLAACAATTIELISVRTAWANLHEQSIKDAAARK